MIFLQTLIGVLCLWILGSSGAHEQRRLARWLPFCSVLEPNHFGTGKRPRPHLPTQVVGAPHRVHRLNEKTSGSRRSCDRLFNDLGCLA
jgi:hypothetical protein